MDNAGKDDGQLELQDEVNEYLDALQRSGEINMFLAPRYVEQEFGVDRRTAKRLWSVWTETFSERHPRE